MRAVQEQVRLWRPINASGIVCIEGTTNYYAVAPNGEVVLGLVTAGAMLARRERKRHVVHANEACVWDSSAAHDGVPYCVDRWSARLLVLETPELAYAASTFGRRDPVIRDPDFAARFETLHRNLAAGETALAVDEQLAELVAYLAPEPPRSDVHDARHDPALQRARELLLDEPSRNITLSELADVAGTSRHRLTRLFRAAYSLPAHRFQIAVRIARARRLLEQGIPISTVAHAVGFVDQSHFHRYFRRTLGITPARYAQLMRSNIQDASIAAS